MTEQQEGVRERLIAFLKFKHINKSQFAAAVGVSNSFVMNIRRGMSPEKIQKIKEVYPDLNIDWLITGAGEMINTGAINQSVDGSNNTAYAGHNMSIESTPSALEKALNEIAEQRKLTAKAQEQVDRLLNIVERVNGLQ